jgi:lysyl-tRNA synthetase class 2
MASIDEIREARLEKLKKLRDAGVNPYPAKVPKDIDLKALRSDFEAISQSGREVSIAGRVLALRGQGAILFAVIFDGTDRIQAIFKKDEMPENIFNLFTDTVDLGDFISVTGPAITSQRGEQSVLAKSWLMASKSLAPLPEKWHGLQDTEERYRKATSTCF